MRDDTEDMVVDENIDNIDVSDKQMDEIKIQNAGAEADATNADVKVAGDNSATNFSDVNDVVAASEKKEKVTYDDFESDVDYTTVLDDFEGPLDLLLYLIKMAKINIEDIFVSKVTEQFLDYVRYMKEQPTLDIDKESEYLQIAAQIIYIKSKSLLLAYDTIDDYVGEEDYGWGDEDTFIEQLKQREYDIIMEKAPKLKERETVGYYYKGAEKEFTKAKIVYKEFNVNAMLEAFAMLMLRNESRGKDKIDIREIPMDSYTVEDRVSYIRDTLVNGEGISKFDDLFTAYSRNEIITTFQALLEMLKRQYVMVEQTDVFGDINIKLNPEWDLKDDSSETFDEYN